MLPFKKLLFPVDYSDSCRIVAPYVRELTERYDAQLTLLHAYWFDLSMSDLALANPGVPVEIRRRELQRMEAFAAEFFPSIRVEKFVEPGDPGQVIKNWIDHQHADLVMLPTHGSGAIRRMLLGSVAAKVLHDASAAVWTAAPAALHRSHVPYKSVLCACDLTNLDEADLIVKAAASIAKKYDASLSLVHVSSIIPSSFDIDYATLRAGVLETATTAMRELKARLSINVPHKIVEDSVAAGVRGEAIRTNADLIVTGRGHEQDTFGRVWSHLYEIVREAPCPVLSV